MLKKTDQDTKIQISKKLRWIALFFQSIILIPAVKVGYVIPENIPFYLIFLFIVLLSNLDLVSKFFPRHKALLIHLSIDLCCFTGLIFLSGKMENPFWPLIYLHAGVAAILLNPKEEYYFIPLLTSSMLTIHLASYSFHTALLYVIVPQWIILMTTWALTRSLGITLLRQSEKLTRLEKKDQKIQKLKSIGSLSAGILHELGTPLNTLRIKVDKLKMV